MIVKKISTLLFPAALALGIVVGGLPSAFGQEAEEEFTLEEITVTAQKRAENSQ